MFKWPRTCEIDWYEWLDCALVEMQDSHDNEDDGQDVANDKKGDRVTDRTTLEQASRLHLAVHVGERSPDLVHHPGLNLLSIKKRKK